MRLIGGRNRQNIISKLDTEQRTTVQFSSLQRLLSSIKHIWNLRRDLSGLYPYNRTTQYKTLHYRTEHLLINVIVRSNVCANRTNNNKSQYNI